MRYACTGLLYICDTPPFPPPLTIFEEHEYTYNLLRSCLFKFSFVSLLTTNTKAVRNSEEGEKAKILNFGNLNFEL
jgi:hypothetical protein